MPAAKAIKAATQKAVSEEKFSLYRNRLMQRAELIFGGLVGLGLKTKLLTRDELVQIFYNMYNPPTRAVEEKKI